MSKIEKPLKYEATVRYVCHEKKCPFDRSTAMQFSDKKDYPDVMLKLYSSHNVDEKNLSHEKLEHKTSYIESLRETIILNQIKGEDKWTETTQSTQ